MTDSPDTLVFDAYGTLFDVHTVTRAAEARFPGRGAALSQAWRGKQLETMWLRSLMGRYADFGVVTADALDWALDSLAIAAGGDAREALLRAYLELEAFPEARASLERLGRGRRLAILSNGTPGMLEAVVAHNALGGHFGDRVLSVHEAGVFKPDPRVYALATSRLGRPAAQIGFVSANGWDAAGGKSFGFVAWWVNRARAPAERLGSPPDAVVADLAELAERLGPASR